ncbi:hypothetical protein HZY97_16965 [Sphingomonas sp. R-74633]|uniref:hypothetical protein n=1 Tax=Sphingomonas sp. R-74633 TaxID=2751188 RepID=UPI0015D2C9AD|nr:hypothetical protein [Sphingomonas sp. R-74633]NYT42466.1 hypothetical protein [Sphingomonas sp. R-74633]
MSAVERASARVADRVREAVPDARVELRDDGLVIEGRDLRARLRWIGGLLK